MHNTRARLVTATNELFRRHGYQGTSLKHVTKAAGATIGSLYHFFPGGKDDLAIAAITESGEAYRQLFEMVAAAAPDAPSAVADFFDGAADVLEETDYIDPCPIGTIAREVASTNEELRQATDQVFVRWIETAASTFESDGLPRAAAEELATTIVATLEGGFVLARARRDATLLRIAGRQARRLTEQAMQAAPATTRAIDQRARRAEVNRPVS
jgi:AcrR family transcriptional regulator